MEKQALKFIVVALAATIFTLKIIAVIYGNV